jgi:hypothetical protein
MDPNANLKEQLELAEALVCAENVDPDVALPKAARLAELVIALDGWLSRGGFPPRSWAGGRGRSPLHG